MQSHLFNDSLGWAAAAGFTASYLCRTQRSLRIVQALAALLWIVYGCATGSLPVIASNTAVAFMAVVYPIIRQASGRARSQRMPAMQLNTKVPAFEELPQTF